MLNRRVLIKSFFLFFLNKYVSTKDNILTNNKLTIIFGSCSNQEKNMDHWKEVISYKPNYIFLLGDNVYGDFNNKNAVQLKSAYNKLDLNKDFQFIKKNIPIIPIWDDHDYGKNDGGKDWIYKKQAKDLFLNFFKVSNFDSRRKREGIYKSSKLFINNKTIKVISLDVRYFKDNFKKNYNNKINKKYLEDNDLTKTILGQKQWVWLEEQINDDYDFLVLLSSFQVLSKAHGWEKWNNFPLERKKLLNLLKVLKVPKLILSGDRHFGGIYKHETQNLYEVTASSFNQNILTADEEDLLRIGKLISDNNFGLLEIDSKNITVKIVSGMKEYKQEHSKLKII